MWSVGLCVRLSGADRAGGAVREVRLLLGGKLLCNIIGSHVRIDVCMDVVLSAYRGFRARYV